MNRVISRFERSRRGRIMKKVLIACAIVLCVAFTPVAAFAIGGSQPGAVEEPPAELQTSAEDTSPEPQADATPAVCPATEQGISCENGYIDADGDGICDNYDNDWCTHRGGGYVDTNNNGTCDNYENGQCPGMEECPQDASSCAPRGQGQGYGYGHGHDHGYGHGHGHGC